MKTIRNTLIVLLLLALLTACAGGQPTESGDKPATDGQSQEAQTTNIVALPNVAVESGGGANTGDASDAPALLTVTLPNGSTFGFSLDDLKALPAHTITVNGSDESGPLLGDVLAAAGVTEYTSVSLQGSGEITLTKEQVTAETLLDFTNRGTVKFASTGVEKNQWPKDITQILVK